MASGVDRPYRSPAWPFAGLCFGGGLLLLAYWSTLAGTPGQEWNSARLFPAFLVAEGATPYFEAHAGPATGWIYGPVMPLLHVPATWMPGITGAMVVAAAINLLLFMGPLLLVIGKAARRGQLDWPATFACLVVALAAPTFVPVLRNYASWIHCDQAAIGLGLISCWLLQSGGPEPSRGRQAAAALCAVLAVWTKQIAVMVPLAQVAYYLMGARDWRRAGEYAMWLAAIGLVVSGACIAYFGLDPLLFDLWVVPGGHALKPRGEIGLLVIALVAQAVALLGLWYAAVWLRRRKEAGAPPRAMGLLLTVALAQLPLGLLAASKVGGSQNSFHALYFFQAMALLAGVDLVRHVKPAAWYLLAGLLAVGGALSLTSVFGFRIQPSQHLETATGLVRQHPGEVYFPNNPLVTWWVEGKAYHLEYGMMDQVFAGYQVSKERYYAFLPPKVRWVVYHDTRLGMVAPQIIPGLKRIPNGTEPYTIFIRAEPASRD